MVTATTRVALRAELARARSDAAVLGGGRVALVPTTGRPYEGHAQLVDEARERGDIVVMSIVAESLQRVPDDDLARETGRAAAQARQLGVQLLFLPAAAEMYPEPSRIVVTAIAVCEPDEDAERADAVAAMLTTTAKLFHLVQPDVAVYAHNDAHRAALIRAMVTDLDMPIEIVVAEESAP